MLRVVNSSDEPNALAAWAVPSMQGNRECFCDLDHACQSRETLEPSPSLLRVPSSGERHLTDRATEILGRCGLLEHIDDPEIVPAFVKAVVSKSKETLSPLIKPLTTLPLNVPRTAC